MGDRTYAWVEIQPEYWPLIALLIEGLYDEVDNYKTEVSIVNYEASYGNMEYITAPLVELRIPYDHGWENGGGYSAGIVHQRFDGHAASWTEFYESDKDKVFIDTVIGWANKESPEEVIRLLEKEKEKYRPPNNQQLENCPIRQFTPEEAAIIMQYKMENAK